MTAHPKKTRPLELRHLELLRELAARGTLAAVAESTHRTPSAVSQQLRTAEREIGAALVEPSSRGVRLTPTGQLLAEGAGEIVEKLALLQARLDASTGEPRGTVAIGTLPSAGEALLPHLVRRLAGSEITLSLDDFDLAEADFAAQTSEADIVIGHSLTGDVPAGAEGLVSTVLAEEPLDVALPVGHRLSSRTELSCEDVAKEEWIGVPQGYPFDTIPTAIEIMTGHPVKRRVRLRDNRLVESLVAQDFGIALLPRFTTRPMEGVCLRPLTGAHAERSIVALSRPDRHARLAVRTVTELLAEIGETLSSSDR